MNRRDALLAATAGIAGVSRSQPEQVVVDVETMRVIAEELRAIRYLLGGKRTIPRSVLVSPVALKEEAESPAVPGQSG